MCNTGFDYEPWFMEEKEKCPPLDEDLDTDTEDTGEEELEEDLLDDPDACYDSGDELLTWCREVCSRNLTSKAIKIGQPVDQSGLMKPGE